MMKKRKPYTLNFKPIAGRKSSAPLWFKWLHLFIFILASNLFVLPLPALTLPVPPTSGTPSMSGTGYNLNASFHKAESAYSPVSGLLPIVSCVLLILFIKYYFVFLPALTFIQPFSTGIRAPPVLL